MLSSLLTHTRQWQQPAAGTQCSRHLSPRLGPRAQCRGDDLISMTTCNLTFLPKAELAPGSGCRVLHSVQLHSVQLCRVLVTSFTQPPLALLGLVSCFRLGLGKRAAVLWLCSGTHALQAAFTRPRLPLQSWSARFPLGSGGWPGLGEGLRENLQAKKNKGNQPIKQNYVNAQSSCFYQH